MTWLREKFGTIVITAIMGLLSLVFVFYGVITPRTGGGANAGSVNGEPISYREYEQRLNQQMEYLRKMTGGKISDEQLKAFRIHEAVFQDLARRKLMIQEAMKEGMGASDDEVKQAILQIPAFQKDGKFDLLTYKEVLQANGYVPASFETSVRDDLSAQRWNEYFSGRVVVTDNEAKDEFMISRDRRNLKYVLLTAQSGAKGVQVSADEVKKFLSDPSELNLVKSRYDMGKQGQFRGKTFEQARDGIARDIVASEKIADVQKVNEGLAQKVIAIFKSGKGASAKLDPKINALLKPYGAEVRTTGMFDRTNQFIPGIGASKELWSDAFASKSPIDPDQGGGAKLYRVPAGIAVVEIAQMERPDLAKFSADREDIVRQLSLRKQHELYEIWLKDLTKHAKIEMNHDIVRDTDS